MKTNIKTNIIMILITIFVVFTSTFIIFNFTANSNIAVRKRQSTANSIFVGLSQYSAKTSDLYHMSEEEILKSIQDPTTDLGHYMSQFLYEVKLSDIKELKLTYDEGLGIVVKAQVTYNRKFLEHNSMQDKYIARLSGF